jgi:release factor glutamine methyltransferase
MPPDTTLIEIDRDTAEALERRVKIIEAMGCGLGVEAAVAALRGARTVHALDVHPDSVAATEAVYRGLVRGAAPDTVFTAKVSDQFSAVPEGTAFDVITFNPPAVSQAVSEDPDVVRNVCVGAPVTDAFFTQIAERALLAPGGEVHLVVSNTADLRTIIGRAADLGFSAEVAHLHDWEDGVLTYLFRLTREGDA